MDWLHVVVAGEPPSGASDCQLRIASELQKAVQEAQNWFVYDPNIGYEVDVEFRFTKPKSAPKKRTLMTKRPDLSFITRSIGEAVMHIALPDSAQIIKLTTSKRYCQPDEAPRIDVVIKKVGQS